MLTRTRYIVDAVDNPKQPSRSSSSTQALLIVSLSEDIETVTALVLRAADTSSKGI